MGYGWRRDALEIESGTWELLVWIPGVQSGR